MEYWKTQLDQVTVLLKGTYAQSTRFDSISVLKELGTAIT